MLVTGLFLVQSVGSERFVRAIATVAGAVNLERITVGILKIGRLTVKKRHLTKRYFFRKSVNFFSLFVLLGFNAWRIKEGVESIFHEETAKNQTAEIKNGLRAANALMRNQFAMFAVQHW